MDQVKEAYRQFLNSNAGRYVEPSSLVSSLVKTKILNKEEAEIINNEPTRAKRQYQLFLKILPMKGKKVYKEVNMVVKGLRLLDTNSVVEAYKDYHSVGGLIKSLKQKGKALDMEKRKRKTLSKESDDGLPSTSTTPTVTTPTIEIQEETVPFGKLLDEHDDRNSFTLQPGCSLRAPPSVTARASSDPGGLSTLAVTDLQPARSVSMEEKVKGATIDPNDLELGSMLGSGGFAVVYRGKYKNETVAVKMFRDYDDFTLTMFFDEVNIMNSLHHENILEFVGFYNEIAKRKLWLLTQFVDGGSMRRFCRRHPAAVNAVDEDGGLTLDQKLYIASCCWRGLDYLHSNNVCHKDISPDNILTKVIFFLLNYCQQLVIWRPFGTSTVFQYMKVLSNASGERIDSFWRKISEDLSVVKIADFGLAEFKQLMTTVVTQISGTPMYYPPEYAAENGILRHPVKSDVYSMGATLCEFFSEQWFWNDGNSPKNHFQVLFLLSEQRKSVEINTIPKEPSCWAAIPEPVQKILVHAIAANYRLRKSAIEMFTLTNDLLDHLVREINDD